VPKQLTFELAAAPPASFSTFVAGPNAEVVDTLAALARGELRETSLVLWGAPGAGKSHLLQAAVAAAREIGRTAEWWAAPEAVPAATPPRGAIVAIDRVDEADAASQARLFTLYNELAAAGGQLVVAASAPPARMTLRDDVRSRLGWGLVFELRPLDDADKPSAVAAFARARGFELSQDAIDYLLAHGRRDMATLVRTITALDRESLAMKRAVTVPFIREWLQGELLPPKAG
jgi:DnaA-homolog protein